MGGSCSSSSVHGILQARILDCHALSQGIFCMQGLNPCLLCLLGWQMGSFPLTPPGKTDLGTVVVSSLSRVQSLQPHELRHTRLLCPSLSPWVCTISCPLSVMPSNHLILWRPLLLMPQIFPSIRVFYNESALRIRWPKYWSFSFIIGPSNEYSGPISFRMDWLDLLAVQGTLNSLLQHHSSKASILLQLSLWSNSHIHT